MTQNTHSDELMVVRPKNCFECPFYSMQVFCNFLEIFTNYMGVNPDCPLIGKTTIKIIEDETDV